MLIGSFHSRVVSGVHATADVSAAEACDRIVSSNLVETMHGEKTFVKLAIDVAISQVDQY